jgi:formyltetrahydrofolate synthetase
VTPKEINKVIQECCIAPGDVSLYGKHMAKIDIGLSHSQSPGGQSNTTSLPGGLGKYVVVTGINPTPLGEGKSTTTIGLAQAFGAHLGIRAFATVRQPAQGVVFSLKGGANGGGYAQIIPSSDFNLHMTGDIHAVVAANNLLAAAIDTRMYHESTQSTAALARRMMPKGKPHSMPIKARAAKLGIDLSAPIGDADLERLVRLDIDPDTISWYRVIDTNDRSLRGITVGQAPTEKGRTRSTNFDIAVASEVMAILALTSSLQDMRKRMGRIVVATSKSGDPVTAEDVGAAGAMTVLMKDAIKPTLMQTLEGTPVLVHAGPFANIAIGNSSIVADRVALQLAGKDGIVITEAGFGADIGAEKFFNMKCRESGLVPNAAVIVATIRALKMHGGGPPVAPGAPLDKAYTDENTELVSRGVCNLVKHVENLRKFGVQVVVAINRFTTDTDAEIELVKAASKEAGAFAAVEANHWSQGGAGAVDLANAVWAACEASRPQDFRFLYKLELSIEEKIETLAREIYNADGVDFSDKAKEQLAEFKRLGYEGLPVCVAKAPASFSHDPTKIGVPSGYRLPIREVKAAIGAGYIYPICGAISKMPGLPTNPLFFNIDIDEDGNIVGLA